MAANVGFGLLFAGMALRERVPVYGSGRPTPVGWWWFVGFAVLVGLLAIAAIAIGLWTVRRLRLVDGPVQPYKYARIGAGLGVVVLLFGVLPIGRQLTVYLATLPPTVFELRGPEQSAALAALSTAERVEVGRYVWRSDDLRGDLVGVLELLLQDASPEVRLEAARGASRIGLWNLPGAVKLLRAALSDTDPRVVRAGAYGVSEFGAPPPPLLPTMEGRLKDPPGPGPGGEKELEACLRQLVHAVYLYGRSAAGRNALRRLGQDPAVPPYARQQARWRLHQLDVDPASPPERE